MQTDLKVNVVYRDKELKPTYEKTYDLQDYADMIRMNLIRIITDVEDLVYITTQNKPKEEWNDETWIKFQLIKHKLLDNAGSIRRLPEDIRTGGEENGKTAMDHREQDGAAERCV